MKILILANNDVGLYNFRKELLEKLIANDNKVYISLPYGSKVEHMIKLGCEFIDTPIDRRGKNLFKDLKLFFKYLKMLKKYNPDVVLTYTIKPNLYGGICCRMRKIKCIPNVTGLGSISETKGVLNKIILLLYKIAFDKSASVFCQNMENRNYLANIGIEKKKLKLIPGSGVNIRQYTILEYPNNETIEFLFIGRIMKEKGIDQYLDTAEHIKEKYPNTVFHVLGHCEEDYKDRLKELEEKNIIEYHGQQKDIIPFLKRSHCTIHPTYYPEGMSNVLLESCASGRPIITTDRSGCREIVDDGINGFMVPIKDTEKLIVAVEKFIKLSHEDKLKMGLKGREKIEKNFDRQIVIEAYIDEIEIKAHRILNVLGGLNRGGAETLVMNIYREIDKEKFRFDFVVHTTEVGEYEQEILETGGKIYRMPKYTVVNHFKYKQEWKRFFKEHTEYKIVHAHMRSTASIFLKIAKKFGIKTISHSHSTSSGNGIKAIIKNILQYNIRFVADFFMGCSKQANIWLFGKKIANSNKCIVLGNSIDVDNYKFEVDTRDAVRNELKIPKKTVVMGHVGRFVEVKNHKFLIEIFEQFTKINSNSKLLLIGKGELQDEIKRLVIEKKIEDKVIFLGTRSDVNRILQGMDIFVMPSFYEGLPVTLIEAQATSLPCLVSDIITDEVDVTKLIYRMSLKSTANKWAERINEIYNKSNRACSKEIMDKIKKSGYDISTTTNQLTQIYYKLLGEK